MEVLNRLLNYNDLHIFQNTNWFNFSLDSVLVAHFVTINKTVKNIVDLGTGNAPIPIILSTRTNAKIYGVEIQKKLYNLAKKSVAINNLQDRVEIINGDIKKISNYFPADFFDIVISNPPYFPISSTSKINDNDQKAIARHEVLINLDDILKVSRKMLKNNGILALVHRPDRLIEIIEKMKKYNIEPKKLRFVYPKLGKDSNMIIIEGMKNGKTGLKILSPLYVHNISNGQYSKEVKKMFG